MNVSYQSLYHVPVAGWLVRDAVHGRPDAKYYFIANIVFALFLLVYEFGYSFVICFALAGAGLGLSGIVFLTASDLLRAGRAKTPPAQGGRRATRVPRGEARHG